MKKPDFLENDEWDYRPPQDESNSNAFAPPKTNEETCPYCHSWGLNGKEIPVYHSPESHVWTALPSTATSSVPWPTTTQWSPSWNGPINYPPWPTPPATTPVILGLGPESLDAIRKIVQEENNLLLEKVDQIIKAALYAYPLEDDPLS